MRGKGSQDRGQEWKRRWRVYDETMQTIEALKEALEKQMTSATDQLLEIRDLIEDEKAGPAPSAPVRNFSAKPLPLNPRETLFPRPPGPK